MTESSKARPGVIAVLSLVTGVVIGFGLTKLAEPRSYEDCIVKNICQAPKGMEGQALIIQACRDKFPEAFPKPLVPRDPFKPPQ